MGSSLRKTAMAEIMKHIHYEVKAAICVKAVLCVFPLLHACVSETWALTTIPPSDPAG